MATWQELISEEMQEHGETLSDTVSTTLTEADLEREFNSRMSFVGEGGCAFTLWTNKRVYFPVRSDNGAEWCASVPRNPDGTATQHIGG